MKASVLGVGTELTDGQIVNKNASWISGRLKRQGLDTTVHVVVPDERALITEALNFCALQSDVIFVTGGLGPTSDDFTRELITAWAGQPLEFHPASWDHLSERLISRGYAVKEMQRQQCFFPRGAEVLPNPQGTANGFTLHARDKKLFVLPGPPREVEAVWDLSIEPWLQKNTKNLDGRITRSWDTLGVGESDIAALVEEATRGLPLERGYRVHLPYVEVKISYVKSQAAKWAEVIEKINHTLDFCTITRDGEDVARLLAKKIREVRSLSLVDAVSGTYLAQRLLPILRQYKKDHDWTLSHFHVDPEAELKLGLFAQSEHTVLLTWDWRGRKGRTSITAPYKTSSMRERRQQFFAESALIHWLRHL
jgi:molybdenum cofactor synthesis domain-containing protein